MILVELEINGNREARSEFNTTQYAMSMKALTGFEPQNPTAGGTFVAHHMVFNKHFMKELLDHMIETTKSDLPWPLLVMSLSRTYYRFSEYKTYATFMMNKHPGEFRYHELRHFGEGGLRFREANSIQVTRFMLKKWREVSNSSKASTTPNGELREFSSRPAYVQLDHVYGLPGETTRFTIVFLLEKVLFNLFFRSSCNHLHE
eukprot:gene18292-18553_t